MTEPKQGKYGLWYIEGSNYGFASKEEAMECLCQRASADKDRKKHSVSEPKHGKYGLWYVDGSPSGFSTKEAAEKWQRKRAMRVPAALLALVAVGALWAWWNSGADARAERAKIAAMEKAEHKFKMDSLLLCQKAIGSTAAYGQNDRPGHAPGKKVGNVWQFLWPHGSFHFKNGFGVDVPQSARCEVDSLTGKIVHLFVSGRTIIG